MKILNREHFLALPPNVLFCKYEPAVFGPLCVKDVNCGENDFFYLDIADSVDAKDCGERFDKLVEAKDKGASVRMGFDVVNRDGLFDKDQLFAVWEPEDVAGFVDRLRKCAERPREQILFSTRREIAAQVDEAYAREPSAKVCTFNTVTFLENLGYLKRRI